MSKLAPKVFALCVSWYAHKITFTVSQKGERERKKKKKKSYERKPKANEDGGGKTLY